MRHIQCSTLALTLLSSISLFGCESSPSISAPSTTLNQPSRNVAAYAGCTYTDQETYQLSTAIDMSVSFQDQNVPITTQIFNSNCPGADPGSIHHDTQSTITRSGDLVEFTGDQADVILSLNGSSFKVTTVTGCSNGVEFKQTVNFGNLDAKSHQLWFSSSIQITKNDCADQPLKTTPSLE